MHFKIETKHSSPFFLRLSSYKNKQTKPTKKTNQYVQIHKFLEGITSQHSNLQKLIS